jgi:ParB family chromosome partitioning protein
MLNTEVIVQIPIDKIKKNPDNEKIFNMDGIEGLANVIKEDGFTGAIEVFPLNDGTYEILSGHRRFEAAKLAGMKTIPSIILPVKDDVSVAKKLITSNIHNRELSSMDKARAIEYYIENVIKKEHPNKRINVQNEVSRVFGLSLTQVKYLRRILKYVPELQDLLEKQLVPMSGLINAIQLDSVEQKELAENLWVLVRRNDGRTIGQRETVEACDQLIRRKNFAKEQEELRQKRERQAEEQAEEQETVVQPIPERKTEPIEPTFVEPIVVTEPEQAAAGSDEVIPVTQYKVPPSSEGLFVQDDDPFPEQAEDAKEELSDCIRTIDTIISNGQLEEDQREALKKQFNRWIELL